MSRFFAILFTLAIVFGSVPAFAQEQLDEATDPIIDRAPSKPTGPLSCFDWYTFGSVQADLQPIIEQTVPGAAITFSGDVVNSNPYPLIDGTLYVKILKRDETTYAGGDGNLVVDQFVIEDDISLSANGKLSVSYDWQVPQNAEGGEYYAAYFFTTAKRYNLIGLSFTDDVIGNQAPFTVTSESKVAKLSKKETTLNGQNHNFANLPLHFSADDTVIIKTTITNPSDEPKTLPLMWTQYAWDSMLEDNLRFTKTEVVTLAPNETKEVSYEVQPQRESVVYVTAIAQDVEAKSVLNIRYVRDGIEETRINFPGISNFPLEKDKEATLFACAHSTNLPIVPDNILTLTLSDKLGNIIHEYRYEGDIAGEMSGFGEDFTPGTNINYAVLTATLERNGVTVEQVVQTFDCTTVDPNTCLPETEDQTGSFFDVFKQNPLNFILLIVGGLLLVAITVFLVKRRHNHIDANSTMTTPKTFLLFLLILPSIFLLQPEISEAKSVTQTHPVAERVEECQMGAGGEEYCNAQGIYTWNVSVTYHLNAYKSGTNTLIPDNSTIAVGDIVDFRPSFLNEYVVYNFVGYSSDSPNGRWVTTLGTETGPEGFDVEIPALTYSHTGTAGLSCNATQSTCTVTSAGTISTTLVFAATDALLETLDLNALYRTTPFSAASLGYTLTAVASNTPPNAPTISGPTTGSVNTPLTFTTTATDPDGDTLRYGIDWDNNGSVDQWVPSSGYVNSGTGRSSNHTWSSAGTYTFSALTQDGNGATSSEWTRHVITVSPSVTESASCTPGTPVTPGVVVGGTIVKSTGWSGTFNNYAACTNFCTQETQAYGANTTCEYYDWGAAGSAWAVGGGICTVYAGSPATSATSDPFGCSGLQGGCAGVLNEGHSSCAFTGGTTADLTINGSSNSIDVPKNTTVNLSWTSANAASCSKWGGTWGNGETIATSGSDSTVVTNTTTYMVNCGGAIDSVTVNVVNQAPNAPTISYISGTKEAGQTLTFSIQGSDPDNDNVFYEVDWDNNGSVNATTMTVPSNTAQNANHSWNTTGTVTFRARTVDSAGVRSGWTSHSETLSTPPAPTTTFDVQVNTNGWTTTNPTNIDTNDLVNVRWGSAGATSCAAAGPGFSTSDQSPNATSGTDLVTTPNPGQSSTYTLTCTGPGGTDSKSITVSVGLPNFNRPIATHNLSTTFNPTTGEYAYVDVSFQTANDGQSGTKNTAPYSVQFDSRSPATGSITLLTKGSASPNFTHRINNIPFGSHAATITVDTNNSVAETNEGDNSYVYNFGGIIPPPDPGLSITADKVQLRNEETTIIRWSTTGIYPTLTCTVTGPGMNVNPAPLTGSQNTQPIVAKSEYTFTCTETTTNTTWTDSVSVETQGVIEEI